MAEKLMVKVYAHGTKLPAIRLEERHEGHDEHGLEPGEVFRVMVVWDAYGILPSLKYHEAPSDSPDKSIEETEMFKAALGDFARRVFILKNRLPRAVVNILPENSEPAWSEFLRGYKDGARGVWSPGNSPSRLSYDGGWRAALTEERNRSDEETWAPGLVVIRD